MSTTPASSNSRLTRFGVPVGLVLFSGLLVAYSLHSAGRDASPPPPTYVPVADVEVVDPAPAQAGPMYTRSSVGSRLRSSVGTDTAVFPDLATGLATLHAGIASTPVQSVARDRLVADLDSRHSAETIDPVWSTTAEQGVAVASESQVMAQAGFSPQDVSMDCRSRSCRISARFDNSGEARDWADRLLTQMAGTIGQARVAVLPQPDGRFEVRVYGSRRS